MVDVRFGQIQIVSDYCEKFQFVAIYQRKRNFEQLREGSIGDRSVAPKLDGRYSAV